MGSLTNIDHPVMMHVSMVYDELNRLTNTMSGAGTCQYRYTWNLLAFESEPFFSCAL